MTKTYGRRRVLDDVDFLFDTDSFHLLVGPNGSGKTTLLRMLATLTPPSSGTIHWSRRDGTETQEPAEVRRRIGYAGHVPLVYDELTVTENLDTLLQVRGYDRVASRRTTSHWLEQVGLAARRDDRADTLSRGMRQRLALAQAFAHEPEILLLDEPGSNLDTAGMRSLLVLLGERRGRSTVLVATHDPAPFRHITDSTLEIRQGKLHVGGTT